LEGPDKGDRRALGGFGEEELIHKGGTSSADLSTEWHLVYQLVLSIRSCLAKPRAY
jgi:hypothetical protein